MITTFLVSVAMAGLDWPREPGTHEVQHTVDGTPVRFTVHVPATLPKRRKPAMVLALHYAGHGAPHYATGFVENLVAPGLQDTDAIIVAPDCPGTTWTEPAAATTTLALLDLALKHWKADPEKVYVMGYSMGGMGTWHFAAAHGDRFAAAIPMAGRPGPGLDQVTIPVYAIHGRQDELIAPEPSEEAIRALLQRGVHAQFDSEPLLTHYDVPRYVPALRRAAAWIGKR